ncbi:uncharacterized protein LOC133528170 [Cydia pomonella]|uniref:uncharacterized protein LOC133528170 n=1 Tax=Cydia pomonella TaxID=82600 RepID=UPI002ADE76E6|nr:uncharacterized protein LOC133528170 [Cydia pomonella]
MRPILILVTSLCSIIWFPDQYYCNSDENKRNVTIRLLSTQKRRKPMKMSASRVTSSPITPTYYNPNPGYDAYWTDGHWIFGTTTTKATSTTSTRTRILVCQKPCPIEYRNVDKVCAHKVSHIDQRSTISPGYAKDPVKTDNTYIHFKTFPTYCEFLHERCKTKIWNNMSWVFIHFGECLTDEEVNLNIDNDLVVLNRKKDVLTTYYNKTFKNIHSEYFKNKVIKSIGFFHANLDIDIMGNIFT